MFNTDGGSLRGSGFYADSADISGLECKGAKVDANDVETDCTFEGEVEVHFDDWGYGTWECPECSCDNEYQVPEYDGEE